MKRILALSFFLATLLGCGHGPTLSGRYVDSDWPMVRTDKWQFNTDGTWSQDTTYHHDPHPILTRSGTYSYDGKEIQLFSTHLVEHAAKGNKELAIPFKDVPQVLNVIHRKSDLVLNNGNGATDTVLHPDAG